MRWTINADGREDIVLYLEYGIPRHLIPKTADGRLLVFEVDGKTVFTHKQVDHPGTKPLGFVRQTQDDLRAEADRITDEMHAKLRPLGA